MSFSDEQMGCFEEVIANVTRHTHVRVIEITDTHIHYEWCARVSSKADWNQSTIKKVNLEMGMKRLEMEINVARGVL